MFPAAALCAHPRTGRIARHHLHETSLQRQIKSAVRAAGIPKKASCHTFRHSFTTPLLESGIDIRTVQCLVGHSDVSTTMIYLHVMKRQGEGAPSPLNLPQSLSRGRRGSLTTPKQPPIGKFLPMQLSEATIPLKRPPTRRDNLLLAARCHNKLLAARGSIILFGKLE